jgi:glycosyltransferase involved in cell wall biosynthesis
MTDKNIKAWLCGSSKECPELTNGALLRWRYGGAFVKEYSVDVDERHVGAYVCWLVLQGIELIDAFKPALLKENVQCLIERVDGLSRLQWSVLQHRPDLAASFGSEGRLDHELFEAWTEEKFFQEYPHVASYLDEQPAYAPSGVSNSALLRWSLSPSLRARFDLAAREGGLGYACWLLLEDSDQITGARLTFTEEHLLWCAERTDGLTRLQWMLLEERADLREAFTTGLGLDVPGFITWFEESFHSEFQHVYQRLHEASLTTDIGLSGPALLRWGQSFALRERFDLRRSACKRDYLCWLLLGDERRLDPMFVLNAEGLCWLGETTDGLTRLQCYLVTVRADLRAAFSADGGLAIPEYQNWFGDRFEAEYPELALCMQTCAQTMAPAVRKPESGDSARYYKRLTRFEVANGERVINLIGYATAQLGIGEDVRMLYRALQRSGYRVNLLDISDEILSDKNDQGLSGALGKTAFLDGISIFCCTAPECERLLLRFGLAFFERNYCIGYFPWELTKWPSSWSVAERLVDRIWVSTSFIRDAFLPSLTKPVVRIPLVVEYDDLPAGNRKAFDIDEQAFVCLFIFDSLSYMARKNPIGHVRAFKQAFQNTENACLLIKTMNRDKTEAPIWQALVAEIAGDNRIRLINETMDKTTLLSLYGSVDVYLSLHRSEGFGRTIAEAMLYGKPVVVSAYSGNLDFCDADNACLVPGQLVAVGKDEYPWSEGTVWFDPDVSAAAGYLRQLFHDPVLREKKGRSGRATMLNHSAEAVYRQYIAPELKAVDIERDQQIQTA